MSEIDRSAVLRFYGLSCLGAVVCGIAAGVLAPLGLGMPAALAMMWTPGLAAIIVRRQQGLPLASSLGLRVGRWKWSIAAALGASALIGLMLPVGAVFPGVQWDPTPAGLLARLGLSGELADLARAQLEGLPLHPAALALLAAPLAGLTINAVFALGEELGWRGFLHDELAPLGFWRANLLTGAMWGLWHAPLIVQGHNWPDHPFVGVVVMVVACTVLAPILGFFRERSDSVWAATFFHGTLNAAAAAPVLVLDGSSLLAHPLGAVGIVAMVLVNGVIALIRL